MSVASHLQRVLEIGADRPAILFGDVNVSWRGLKQLRDTIDDALNNVELGRDAIVGLLGRNCPAMIAGYVALIAADRAVCLINALRPTSLIGEELEELRLGALLVDGRDVSDELLKAAASVGTMVLALGCLGDACRFEVLTPCAALNPRPRDSGTLIEIQTSGTTGKPKRVAVAERTMSASLRDGVRNAQGVVAELEITPKQTPGIMFSPLVHTSGAFNTLMTMFEARPLVLLEKFDVAKFRDILRRYRPKFLPLPPPALRMLLDSDAKADEFDSVLAVRCGTAALAPDVQAAFEERFGVPVLTTYGATEFMGVVTSWTLSDYKVFGKLKRGSVGRPPKGVEIRVIDPGNGAVLPADCEGVLEVKLARVDEGRAWIRTADLARIDADGFLFILGRADDAISRGGFKILASHVADALRSHPDVCEVAVVGRRDERLGEAPVAVVELRAGRALTPETMSLYARSRLAPYECPARIYIVPQLPRTVSDKVAIGQVRAWLDQVEG